MAGQERRPSGATTAPSEGRCGVSRPSGMRWLTGTPRPRTATSAISRRWQRHHTLSLHITATVAPRRLGEHLVEGGGELRRPGVRGVGGELGDGPPVVRDRLAGSEPAAAAQPVVPAVADADGGQPLLERLPPDVGVAAAAREAADVDDPVDPRAGQPRAEGRAVLRAVAHRQQRHGSSLPGRCGLSVTGHARGVSQGAVDVETPLWRIARHAGAGRASPCWASPATA